MIEPPAFGLAADDPQVAAYAERQEEYWARVRRSRKADLIQFNGRYPPASSCTKNEPSAFSRLTAGLPEAVRLLNDPGKLPGVVTEMTCEDVIEVLAALDAGEIDYWIDGGWGIDALVGEQTRTHHDLDLGVSRDDVARVEALLPQFPRESEKASFYTDERGRAVDLILVELTQAGQLEQQLPEGGRLRYAESETHASGWIGGRLVRCATVALQCEHRNHPNATDQDRTDVEAVQLRRRTSTQLSGRADVSRRPPASSNPRE